MLNGCVPWPDDLAARYRTLGLWTGETLGDLLRPWAASDPGRIAVVDGGDRWTYAELDARADRLAAGLLRLGVGAGDRVLVHLPNTTSLVYLTVALFRIGALPVYALPAHRRVEIAYLLAHTEAVAYVVPDRQGSFDFRELATELALDAPALRTVLVDGDPGAHRALDTVDEDPVTITTPDPGEVAFFLLSGGTTGLPKLIPRTHDDYALQLRRSAESIGVGEDSVYLAALPVAHNAALGCPGVLGTLRAGGKVVLSPTPSPDDVFPRIDTEGVTITTLMPSLLAVWTELAPLVGTDLSGLVVEVGGAVLHPRAAHKAQQLGIVLSHWFGMAEGVLWHTRLDDPPETAASTQGRPLLDADEYRIVDEYGNPVSPGEEGEFVVQGPCTLRGYYASEVYNRTAFTLDGFLRTGDLVRLDPAGNLVVTGRVKDVINRGGEKIGANELEGHIESHPGVRAAAVFAVPDASLGEKICAAVVPSATTADPVTLTELRAYLTERGVAAFKLPDQLRLVPELAMTGAGKIDKAQVRRALVSGGAL